jgi:hypothetical protein
MAQQTGRTLILDWTNNKYYAGRSSQRRNVFLDLFEDPTPHWDFPAECFPSYPPYDRAKHVFNDPMYFPHKLAMSNAVNIEMNCFLLDQIESAKVKPFYDTLTLTPPVQKTVDDFAAEHFTDDTLGIHVRHGDGEKGHFVRSGRVFKHPEKITERIVRRVRQEQDATGCTVFLATDSLDIYDAIKAAIPEVVFRHGWRPPRNQGGPLQMAPRKAPHTIHALHDAAIDMWLLARCRAFLQPSWSYFTSYATAMEVPKIPL